MAHFRQENQEFLRVWEPRRTPEFYTEAFWRGQLRRELQEFIDGESLCLALLDARQSEVVGVCNFTNILRGTFQSCHLGYALGQRYQGQGLMFEALQVCTRYVFEEIGLNRIMANYLPRNDRSGRLLARLGFDIEGQAKRFLRINGIWEDHVLTSLLNPIWR